MFKNVCIFLTTVFLLIHTDIACAIKTKREKLFVKQSREQRRSIVTVNAAVTSFVTTFLAAQIGGNPGTILAVAATGVNINYWQQEAIKARHIYVGEQILHLPKINNDILQNTLLFTTVQALLCFASESGVGAGVSAAIMATLFTSWSTYFGVNWEV